MHKKRPKNKHLFGRADVETSIIRRESLDVIRDEPPPDHANIEGWPKEKEYYMSQAQEIAENSVFTYNPDLDN